MHQKLIFLLLLFCSTLLFSEEEKEVLSTHDIRVSGEDVFDEGILFDAMSATHKSFFKFWSDETPKIKDKLIITLPQALRSFYDSEGYYDATFEVKETKTMVSVKVKENKPVKVRDINISSDFDIEHLIKLKKDDVFKTKKFISIKAKIAKALLKEGYCSHELDSKAYVDLEKHIVDLVYKVSKGGVCTFGKLTVSGQETIREEVIASRVRAREGERFNLDLVKETSDNLYGLHAFDSVSVNIDRKFYNVVPVDIKVAEVTKPYQYEVGVGYDTYVGPRVHGQITRNNFLGDAQQLKLKMQWSKIEQVAILDFSKPVLFTAFDFPIDYGASLGMSNLEFDGFKEYKTFFTNYLQYQSERTTLQLGWSFENIKITTLDNLDGKDATQAVNEGDFLLTYPYINYIYDARDSKINPKNGYYFSAYVELGMSMDDNSSMYYKSLIEARVIHTFSDVTLAAVGKVGVLDIESTKGLPESKYFFAGGAFSNRAYGFRELGVITSRKKDTINGASTWANLTLEANYPVWGELSAAVFNDNTMLTEKYYDFSGDIISSVGLGARYATPIGTFKVDVGFNVADFSQYNISFQMGQSF